MNEQLTGPHAAGVNSILPKEHGSQFFYLPIIRHSDDEVSDDLTALLWPNRKLGNTHMYKHRCGFITVCHLSTLQSFACKSEWEEV